VLEVSWGSARGAPLSLLCIGAHSDDIEIGCGGTILRLLAERPGSTVQWVVLSADDAREREARASAEAFLDDAKEHHVEVCRFRESYFPWAGAEIKDHFNALRQRVEPDVVFCHHREDEHQDHRTVGALVWNTFREHLIAEYEIPKYEGDLGHPNLFVTLSPEILERKVALLMEHFGSQADKRWFRPDTFRAMATLRGVESGTALAEAFHVRKLVL
jgi:LmbE family N-acetylglucosaminyl deacetylase